ncbi:MAG: aminotransferase class III-fold pyridoxal phosphate-dependent enzyme [Arenicellales bacterium]
MYSIEQQRHIGMLVDRLMPKLARSAGYDRTHRQVLADPRRHAAWHGREDDPLEPLRFPVSADWSRGARLRDVDGNEYTDYAMGFGVQLFGHGPAFIRNAIERELKEGSQVGAQCPHAYEAAALICDLTGVERVAFCNSGTEAVMYALRLARAVTERPMIGLFARSYHGAGDEAVHTIPWIRGISPGLQEHVLVLKYGDPSSLAAIEDHAGRLAGILVEPIQARRPEMQPSSFLRDLRELTARRGIALIFDEVLLGFRLHQGGAQAWFDIRADLVTYGKILGGGLPVGAVCGKTSFMAPVDDDPDKMICLRGTFNKNPFTMAAAVAVLNELGKQGPALQEDLNLRTNALAEGLNRHFQHSHIPMKLVTAGSLFRFRHKPQWEVFYYHLMDKGFYSNEHRLLFLSTAHTDDDVERFACAVRESAEEMKAAGFC